MIRIAHLTSVHFAYDTRIFHRECRTLVEQGYDVTLIVAHDRDEVTDDVRIRAVPKPRGRLTRVTRTQWQVYRAARAEKADVYHFHDPELIGVGLLLKTCTRAAVVYDVHEHYPDTVLVREWIPNSLRPVFSRLFDRWETFTGRYFDLIVTADEDVASRFQGKQKRVITLFNFPLKKPYARHNRLEAHHNRETEPIRLIYVGVMGGVRGLWLMLEAMGILLNEYNLDVELVLAGRLHSRNERERLEREQALNPVLAQRVRWLGRVPQSEVPSLLASADIGWVPWAPVPKHYKNIPTKLFEYMAVGLPVVGSDLPPIRRYIEETQAGYLAAPEDPRAHAEQILRLIRSPETARQMGENGRQAFFDRYNWDTEAEKLATVYKTLLKGAETIG